MLCALTHVTLSSYLYGPQEIDCDESCRVVLRQVASPGRFAFGAIMLVRSIVPCCVMLLRRRDQKNDGCRCSIHVHVPTDLSEHKFSRQEEFSQGICCSAKYTLGRPTNKVYCEDRYSLLEFFMASQAQSTS